MFKNYEYSNIKYKYSRFNIPYKIEKSKAMFVIDDIIYIKISKHLTV